MLRACEISRENRADASANEEEDGRRIDWIRYRIKEREDRFSDQGDASSVSRLIHKHAYPRCSLVISWLDNGGLSRVTLLEEGLTRDK